MRPIHGFIPCSLVLFIAAGIFACGGGGSGDAGSFNTSCFPLDIAGSTAGYGNIAFDGDGNLLIPFTFTHEVLTVDRITCVMSTLAAVPTLQDILSVVYHPGMDTVYVGDTNGSIFAINPSSGAGSLHVNIIDDVTALVVAPVGYGAFGEQLIASRHDGILMAVDTASTATTEVGDAGDYLSDIEFAGDGTLYGVTDDTGSIITITAEGVASVFATGFEALDGIAVDDGGGQLLIADSDADLLYGVQMSDGARTVLDTFDFDGGWYPAGMAFDGETLLMATGESSLTIEAFIP